MLLLQTESIILSVRCSESFRFLSRRGAGGTGKTRVIYVQVLSMMLFVILTLTFENISVEKECYPCICNLHGKCC